MEMKKYIKYFMGILYMKRNSILYLLPDEELESFHLFRIEADLYATLGKKMAKHKILIYKWYDLLGFTVKEDGPDLHIVAKEYYDDKIRFKLWRDGDNIKLGGIVDSNGNFIELFKEFEYGNPHHLRKTDLEYKRLQTEEVMHTLPLVDMLKMIKNINHGRQVARGMINGVVTSIFMIPVRDTMRYYEDQQITDKVNYYLYYDNKMNLSGVERRNEKGAVLTIKINRRSDFIYEKDASILEEIERNY